MLSGPGNRRPRAVPRPGEAPHGGRARARRPRAASRAGIQGRHGDRRRARGERQRAARRDADLNYYVYYKLDPARLAELRPAIEALFKAVEREFGVRGRWMRRRDDPATYMEVYEGIADEEAFDAMLDREGAKLGLPRKVERFVSA
ncbi:MAG: DUF4936 family protein [Betaproteobacteria bacterium]|nr:MAG: DUF4936 family protein [Betaproteobacteria bacterium]